MKMRKALAAFLAMICIVNCFGICTFGVSAEGTTAVYAETSAALKQGETGYAYIYIDDLQALATVTVTVYFDPAKITVPEAYNQVGCVMYDSAIGEDYVQFTYLFDGEGSQEKTNLFYFYYNVKDSATLGTTYFDITVSDACDAELNELAITGSRCNFRINEKAEEKYCSIYADDYIYTSVQQEFTLSYWVDSWDIASGAFVIQYDPELFECVGWSSGAMLEGKLTDVNASLGGSVYVSFVGTEYNGRNELGSITFRTKKNVTESANIHLKVTNFYDLELNNIACNGYKANVNIQYDESYMDDAPKMSASATYNAQTQQVTVQIQLDANSHLGAGDFVLRFDENALTYRSAQKEFQPSFFLTNTQKVNQGELRFSIISTTDIITEEIVITVTFDANLNDQQQDITFDLSGTGLANAMTETIVLNFVDTSIALPQKQHSYQNGICTGCGIVLGDLDLDGDVDAQDLTILARHVAGIERLASANALSNADVNGDGSIDASDLTMHARYVAGIITDWEQE